MAPPREHTAYHTYRHHLTETLVDALADLRRASPLSPFDQDVIVVQGGGMSTWLARALAEREGIAANLAFQFPTRFLAEFVGWVLPEAAEGLAPYREETMTWWLFGHLPTKLDDPTFRPLAEALKGDRQDTRLYHVSRQIAGTFQRYLIWRPELLRDWGHAPQPGRQSTNGRITKAPGPYDTLELPNLTVPQAATGAHAPWQRQLWRDMTAALGPGHMAAVEPVLMETLKRPSPAPTMHRAIWSTDSRNA